MSSTLSWDRCGADFRCGDVVVTAPDRAPVVIGVAQVVDREVDPGKARDPVALMADAALGAAEDARIPRDALAKLDRVVVPLVLCGRYSNAACLLSERLGAAAASTHYLPVGGNTPQKVVNDCARDIAHGRAELALLAGAEALQTRRRARVAGISLDWSGGGDPTPLDPERAPSSPVELRHALGLPATIYPLYENALRAHHGRDAEAHRRIVGAMLSRFAATAARNPYAWFRRERSPDEITLPTPDNRMVAYPYTKYMNAILTVNQSAAVLITSAGRARALGVPADRMVYWLGGGDAVESPWTFTEREDFHSSKGMARAFAGALTEAGLEVADVSAFDLYSCFPSSVELACDTLGLSLDDPRPLTVTGGLPYAGGPGNNYSTHAIASMVERIRADSSEVGMVSGVGWYFSKHSAGLYGAAPPVAGSPGRAAVAPSTPSPTVPVAESAAGRGRIETYTVLHDREGAPEQGIAVGRLEEDERRFVAFVDGDAEALAAFEAAEAVGRTGRVWPEADVNRFAPD